MMAVRHWRLGFLGFGNVNRTLARMLVDRRAELEERHGLTFRVTLAASARRGAIADGAGLEVGRLLKEGWSSGTPTAEAIRTAPVDLVFEGTPLDPLAGEPATGFVRAALGRGVSVVSGNKGPVAFAARELMALALRTGAGFRFESAVADSMPLFSLVESSLPIGRVIGFTGVLNSTSNYVLENVARGGRAEEAIAEMQRRGFAEADPSYDLDGWDQAVKAVCVANVLMGRDLRPADIERVPLRELDVDWIRAESRAGRVVRLLASGRAEGPVRVGPVSLEAGHFLATLRGLSLGIALDTEPAGTIQVAEVDAGLDQTAYGMLADLVAIHQGRRLFPSPLLRTN